MELPTFDELLRIAEESPEQLEVLRQELVEDAINNAPKSYERRLRGLQFQIDMERRRSKTPMAACIRISKMMHDHLYQLREVINGDEEMDMHPATEENEALESQSSVIPFPAIANR